jgi:hypothetical protein
MLFGLGSWWPINLLTVMWKEIPNVVLATNEKAQGGLVSRGTRPWGKGRGKERYIPHLFPMCSHQVLKIFSLGS